MRSIIYFTEIFETVYLLGLSSFPDSLECHVRSEKFIEKYKSSPSKHRLLYTYRENKYISIFVFSVKNLARTNKILILTLTSSIFLPRLSYFAQILCCRVNESVIFFFHQGRWLKRSVFPKHCLVSETAF